MLESPASAITLSWIAFSDRAQIGKKLEGDRARSSTKPEKHDKILCLEFVGEMFQRTVIAASIRKFDRLTFTKSLQSFL